MIALRSLWLGGVGKVARPVARASDEDASVGPITEDEACGLCCWTHHRRCQAPHVPSEALRLVAAHPLPLEVRNVEKSVERELDKCEKRIEKKR